MKIDLHMHTTFSDGQPHYKEVIDKAKLMGMDLIAITDHFDNYDPSPHIRKITDKELLEYFKNIKEYAELKNQKVLCGIETCTDFKGNLRISDIVYNASDIIITSPHYIEFEGTMNKGEYFNQYYWEAYKFKLLNMAEAEGDVLGHPEGYLPINSLIVPGTTTYEERKKICRDISHRYFDNEFLQELCERLLKKKKAYELHCITETPREEVIEYMAEKGVKFSIGSDAHVLEWVGKTHWGVEMINKYNGSIIYDLNFKE